MPDYSSHINLGHLVSLTARFLTAAEQGLRERDAKADLRLNLTLEQTEAMNELVQNWVELNAQVDQIITSGLDMYRMDILTNQLNAASLQIHDILLSSAEKLLGKPYMQFIAPDGLRTVSALELLELNQARNIRNLLKTSLQ